MAPRILAVEAWLLRFLMCSSTSATSIAVVLLCPGFLLLFAFYCSLALLEVGGIWILPFTANLSLNRLFIASPSTPEGDLSDFNLCLYLICFVMMYFWIELKASDSLFFNSLGTYVFILGCLSFSWGAFSSCSSLSLLRSCSFLMYSWGERIDSRTLGLAISLGF